MSRRGNSHSKQLQNYDGDPFREVHQIMRGFGGFDNDPFFGGMMKFGSRDPFEDMFKFSDLHKNMHQKGTTGSYVCQSFVSSSKMGPDGKIIRQDYFQNNMGQHKGGNTISQKQQAYKNNSGVNRIAEQRMLNDKGRKIVRQKIGNNIEETNHYYNIDEEEAGRFDSDWRQQDREMRFLENHQKHLKQLGSEQTKNRALGYEQKNYRPQQQQIQYDSRMRKPETNSITESRNSKRTQGSINSNTRKY